MIRMSNITIDPEFRDLIPPLTDEEFNGLERKLLSEGCTEPLKLWAHGDQDILIDGHHRYRICQTHGIDMPEPVYISNLESRTDVKIWMIRNQIGRRNLSDFARTEIALMLKPLLAEKAKQNSVQNLKNIPSYNEQNSATQGNGIFSPAGRVDEQVAKSADVSRNTVQRVEKILESGNDEIIEKARSGEMSINAAYKAVKPKKAKQDKPETVAVKSEEQQLIDDAMEGTSLESIIDDLSKQNEQLIRTLDAVNAKDKEAKIREQQEVMYGYEQRINMLTKETYEKDKQLRWQNNILRELLKLLGIDRYADIIGEVRKLKGV